MISLLGLLIKGPCWEINLPDTSVPARMRFEGGPRVYTVLTEFGVFSMELRVSEKPLKGSIFKEFKKEPQLLGSDTLSGWALETYLAQGDLWRLEVPNTTIVLASRKTPCGGLYMAFLVPSNPVLFDEKRLISAVLSAYNVIGK